MSERPTDTPPPPNAPVDPAPRRRRPRWGRWLLGCLVVAAIPLLAGLGWAWWYYQRQCDDPCVDLAVLRAFSPNEASIVYDRQAREIGRFYVEDRRVSDLSSMPTYLPQAFLAIEDARFFRHSGVDPIRLLGAARANLRREGGPQGGSTITMQLARNIYPDVLPPQERTIERKLREIHVARAIERAFPKDSILQHYLNTIYLGAGAYGVDAAARAYFGKPARQVTVAEAALLAAMPQAPSVTNPFRRPAAATARRNLVLARMRELGYLDEAGYRAALGEPLRLIERPRNEEDLFLTTATVAPYFVEALRLQLQRELGPALYRGGYRIYTTLDADLAAQAEQLLERELLALEQRPNGPRPTRAEARQQGPRAETAYLQAGLVVLDAELGDVLVLIGGRAFGESPFNRMTQAYRQTGSAFKPFVFAAALRAGWRPTDSISDGPVEVRRPGGIIWRPNNFNRTEVNGTVSLETALARSLNRATVRLGLRVGLDSVLATASLMGLETPLLRVPAVLLGAADVIPLDLVRAYAPLARPDGRRLQPRYYSYILDRTGRTVMFQPPTSSEGLDPAVAGTLRGMLRIAVERGTGTQIRRRGYVGAVAGKTGTTNGTTNAWFLGVTPDHIAGVWVGFDQPRAILPDSTATGGRVAAPIWAEVMKLVPQRHSDWPQPEPQDSTE